MIDAAERMHPEAVAPRPASAAGVFWGYSPMALLALPFILNDYTQ